MHICCRPGENSSCKPQVANGDLVEIVLLGAEVSQPRHKLENLRQALLASRNCWQIMKLERIGDSTLQVAQFAPNRPFFRQIVSCSFAANALPLLAADQDWTRRLPPRPPDLTASEYLSEYSWASILTDAPRADSSGRRNTLTGVAMNSRKRRSDRSGRVRLFSPVDPPVAGREERRRFWAAIAAGAASEDAAVGVGVPQAVGTRWFRKAGGMPPSMFGLSAKPLCSRYLSFAEREEIALLRVQGYSMQEVARRLGRVASTISRELRRNAATRSGGLAYRATTAQWHAERAARRPKQAKLARNAALRTYVEERLAGVVVAPSGAPVPGPVVSWKSRRHGPRKDRRWANAWSPEQIARRLPVDFPDDATMRISHEAIYQALFVQGRGALRRELTACLRTGRVLRMPRARTRGRGKAFISPEIMISQRPAEAADRAVPGHWEGDLILGLGSSAIGTLVERTTRFTLLLYLPRMAAHGHEARVKNGPELAGHGAEAVRDAISRTIVTLPEQLRRSLTWDQGAEMAQHARLKIEAGVQVYFCDPHSPWQRGTNENTNGLLRQYFPKGTDLSMHSANEIAAVAAALNSRPRKTLDWKTPAEALDRFLLSADKDRVATTALNPPSSPAQRL